MTRPQTYQRPMRKAWFLERPAYLKFILRELTSVFLALYLVFLLVFLGRGFAGGGAAFAACLASLTGPGWRVFHLLVLAAAVFHAVTWFNMTPLAVPLQVGDQRVRPSFVALALGYGPWIVVTGVIVWALWV